MIQASRGRVDRLSSAIKRLHELDPLGKNAVRSGDGLLAAQAELQRALERRHAQGAGIAEYCEWIALEPEDLFGEMRTANVYQFPRISELINSWESTIDALAIANLPPRAVTELLLGIGSEVRY